MRSRIAALMLGLVMVFGFAGCSKKEQTQTTPAPASEPSSSAASQSTTANPAAAGQPAQQMATGQQQAPGQPAPAPMAEAPPPPPPPPPLVIPAGTSIVVRMGNTITSKSASNGDPFNGSLAHAVTVHGVVAIPAGAGVSGAVVNVKSPGKFKGEGILSITLTGINIDGVSTAIQTSTYTQTVKGKGKRTAVAVGGGTGAGALIGGIAGGGKGALIGGVVGAGVGTAGAAFTGNKELEIPAESAVTFKLSHSITVQQAAPNQ